MERLAMFVQSAENIFDLDWNGLAAGAGGMTYADVYLQAEREFSAYNFEVADTVVLFRHFDDAEKECRILLQRPQPLTLPAYDQCMKASHLFNLLDARGVISVTERQSFIGRVRVLAKGCCEGWLASRGQAAKRG
jgi:glycyl-tRNA synthetase alpha chain